MWFPLAAGLAAVFLVAAGARIEGGQAGARGTIEGHVRVIGPTPGNSVIRMGADPVCAQLNRGKLVLQAIVVKSGDDGLANAFVHVQGSFPAPPVPSAPVTLDQQGCIYGPRVVGARVGQTLQIANSDPTGHNLHALSRNGNDFNTSQPVKGMLFTFPLKSEEVMLHIRCDVHSWMNTYVGVVSHPYFAVSGEAGSFTISGVPAGRRIVQAWHERFGTLTQTVDVKAGATTAVDFTYVGSARRGAGGR